MTYEEYKKQRLAQNNTQSNVSNATKINTAPVNRYEEYKKQRLAQNSFNSSKNIQKFNNIFENGQKMKINMTPTQAVIEKGKQLYQEPNILKNIKPEMSYVGDAIDKENILKKDSEYLQQTKKQKLEKMNQRTNELIAMTYKNKLANGVNLADDKNVITSLMGRKLGQKPSDKGNLLKVPENMKDNNRRFEDGYQFGDISKTALENLGDSAVAIGSTALEVPARLVKGILSVPEGIANAGASIVAGISDMVGQDDYANELRRRVAMGTPFVKTHAFMDNAIDKLNSNSFSGNLLDSATEGIGQSGGQMAVGAALGKFGEVPIKFGEHTLNMPTTAFVTGMGNSASETYAKADEQLGEIENATGKEKLQMALRILRGGTVEGVSEGLFGLLGVGGTDITEEFAKKAVAKAETAFEKQLTKIIIAGGGEAAEEFISYASNYLLDNYANKFGQLDFSENWNWDDVMQEMASAFISSGISQGVTSAVQINKATQNAIQLAETEQGRQLTPQEISEIRNSVANEVLGAREELENAQNSTSINENTPNIEQISQNNVQNVSDLEKNQQMSISDKQNRQATVTDEIQTFVENRNKIAPGLNVEMDNTLQANGVIIKKSDGTRTIKINPNSTEAYEFVAVHEMLHDLEGTQEYSELKRYVQDRATSHEEYEPARQAITAQYENFYKANNLDMSNLDMDVETVNDMVTKALGNQQFLNELAGKKPNVFMKMYNWVKNVLFDGQNTGKTFNERRTDNKYLQELKRKFENAYNTVYKGNANQQYSIQTDANGNKYVKVDTDQDIFEGKTLKEQKEIARKYILEKFREKGVMKDNQNINITKRTAKEYTYPKNILNKEIASNKMKASTELDNILNISKYKYSKKDDGRHPFAKAGWEYYETVFQVGNKTYTGLLNVANDGNKKMLYDITNIKEMSSNNSIKTASSANPSLKYSIPSSDGTVNTQYMQNNEKNSQGLENSSSFSLSKDNQGRTLSKEQQDYFNDSKVRDESGNLLEVYHGTEANAGIPRDHWFTVFDIDKAKVSTMGDGFYFTDNYERASSYAHSKGNVYKAYLNITNPFMLKNGMTFQESIKEINPNYDIDKLKMENSSKFDGTKLRKYLIDNGYDGISLSGTYVAFNPNQIKSVDNTKPTSNPDIRYSQSNGEWSKYLKENWDLMPNSKKTFGFPANEQLQAMDNKKISESADVLNMKEKKIKSLEEIANMTENDAKTENGVNYKHKKDKNTPYQRKFFENVETSKIINQEVKDTIEMTTYERQANEQTLEKAKNSLDEQGDKLIKQWERKTKNFTAEDVAIGAILIERYQQQGDNESAVNVVQKLADMGTEAGRAVQMFSIFQRLTPEAMLIYQQRKLNDVFKEVSQRKTGEWVEANKDKFQLTSEDGKFITEQVEKAQQATSERQKQIELAKIEARINNKLPPDRGQTIKAIRRISMLFNPKTQVRNIVGNTLIMPVNDVADIIGTQIDKAIAKRTGIRTTNNPIFKEKGKGFKKGIAESIQDYKMGIRTEPSGSKYEFNFGGKSFNENTSSKALNVINNKLNGIENLLGAVMSGGDRPFYEAAFNNSLQGQMKANNVMTPTTEMIDIAVNEALSRTWNDSNSYTEAVLGIRRQMNKLNIGGFGLGDLIIPFAKTPANLTKAMVEYSPLGTIEAIINYSDMKKAISRGEMTAQQQKNFVNSTSKAIAGSILYLIAGALVQSGAVTGSADDDKDIKNFEQNVLGIQPYSIKIGDKTFTYSWANPLNAPLAIMADTYKMSKEKAGLFDILTNGFKVAGEVVVDNSFLQGIKELFEADSISEGVVNAIVDMPAQFIPTFLSQFATLGDKNKRQTFEYGDKLKSTINQIKVKIPGAKNTLAPTVNTFGEEVENYGGDTSAFNVFLNPANISKANATDTQKELYALYEATKDKTIFPMQAPYYLSDDGEKVNLSSNERSEYQKRSGEYVSKELHALFDSEFYKTLENEDKVEVVNKIVKDANTHAKSKWITTKATKELKKIQEELKDVPMVDYYNAWLAQKDAEGKKNAKGETISGTKKKAKIKAINGAVNDDLTTYQKKALYRIFNVN